MICFISSSKPISRIRSASSMTSAFRFLNTKPLVFCHQSPMFEESSQDQPGGDPAIDQESRQSS